MPIPELLVRPTKIKVSHKPQPQKMAVIRERIGTLVLLLITFFVVSFFLKLIEYEGSPVFHWLHRPVQINPAWY